MVQAACEAARARLRWEIELRDKSFEVQAKAERGAPLPQWFLDEPLPTPGTRLVVDIFWELNTERYVGWVPGYIPQHCIEERAARLGLSGGMMALFVAATRACDDEYLASLSRKRGRSTKEQT